MSSLQLIKAELAAAVERGVRQCVVIGSRPVREAFGSSADEDLQLFAVDEEHQSVSPGSFDETGFASEALGATLEKSGFDRLKASLFVWLGDTGFRTADAVIAGLAFIASLPRGSGVVFDYAADRVSLGPLTRTALDALASRVFLAGDVRYLIQPQALTAMLRSLGFQQIVELSFEETGSGDGHLVCATV